jgi:hypothetical protein
MTDDGLGRRTVKIAGDDCSTTDVLGNWEYARSRGRWADEAPVPVGRPKGWRKRKTRGK